MTWHALHDEQLPAGQRHERLRDDNAPDASSLRPRRNDAHEPGFPQEVKLLGHRLSHLLQDLRMDVEHL